AEEKVLSLKHPDFLSELDRRPRLLCANISPENFEFYMPRIIANGIALFSTDNISLAEEAFGKYNITHFLLDTDIDGGRWLDLVKGVSEKRDRFQTFLLYGLSTNHLEEYKTKVQVSKTYDKGMDKKELVKKMIEDINSSDPDFSSRSHLKVLVTEEEPVKVSIYIREDQVIEGLGYSISPLEIVLRLIKDVKGEMYNFSKGDSLERVSVTVFGKISLTQAEVTNLDHANQRITLKFTHRSESLLGGIGKLILNKLKTVTL
ncbi:MAG: hypothetical protein OEZ36_04120, partial [Spirochaetota bacterium]|nr:hypothetical protein [Spirochaetota bacterium]